jgi:hypothetical protein
MALFEIKNKLHSTKKAGVKPASFKILSKANRSNN